MASDIEASCVSDPNFAVICSFLECFGKSCGINYPDIAKLQEMLEDAHEVPQQLVELHVKLLRKLRKTVTPEKWERSLVKFCHTYSNQDGWELERFGYKKARIGVKLRLLKVLLEAQFDLNSRFKLEVNKLAADELRVEPLGRDKTGLAYWFQLDDECNIRVYREDLDEENWELVARDREGVVNLINSLSDGEPGPIPINDESSNSLEISEKPIIDTGQVDESMSLDEDTKLETAVIANDTTTTTTTTATTTVAAATAATTKPVNEVLEMKNEKISDTTKIQKENLVKNVADDENVDEEGDEEEEEDEDEEEDEEEEEDDDEEVSNEDSSKANSEEEDDDDEDENEDEEDDDDSQEAKATQNQTVLMVTPSKINDNKVPPMTIQAKHNVIGKEQRAPWKNSQIPIASNFPQSTKSTAPRLNIQESTHVKAIETPVITSPLKLVNIQELQNPVEDRGHARDEKYTVKSAIPFQSSDSPALHARHPIKPIDKLAANLSRIQTEKLEKPGAAKLLEKIAENLARSSVAQGNLVNGDDDKVQEFLARSASEKSTISIVPARNQRGMDLSTSPRGWETTSDHARPMDYSGIDLSSRKVIKPTDLHSSAYRTQDFQHREMDLSTRKIVKTDMASMPYDSRTVILRNHGNTTMVTDLSKKQIPYSGYDLPQSAPYHSGPRIMGKDETHRLPNYTILPDPSKIASMRMAGGSLKRPLDHIDDSQQEILKRMRQEGITLRGPIDKRTTAAASMMAPHRRDEIVGAAIEEPVMMIQGEGSGSDCDAVNPIVGDAIEEPIIFFYGTGTGRDCDTGNPGDETSSDNKESNESKKEGCSDVTTSLTTRKILTTDENINETSSDDDKSSHRINANYSQSTGDIGSASDHCQSTVVSSVSQKEKFKPTLGIQVIARTSGNLVKKSSRWDVGRPEDNAECDSSIVTSEQHISTADESIINTRDYDNMDIGRLASTDDCVVEGKNESDDITSTSSQTFGASKIAECTSSYDIVKTDQIPSTQPDSSFINEPTSVTDCKSSETKILHIEQCDSSVPTAIPSSSLDHGESVESTIKEGSNLDNVKTCVLSKHERDKQTGSTNDSPPRFFFGPNCVSYSSKVDEARLAQVAGTSFNTPENVEIAKNNNNFVKAADTQCSESSSGSCESNIETRLKNIEITEEKGKLDCPDKVPKESVDPSIRSDYRVQSSTSPGPKHRPDCIETPESITIPISRKETDEEMDKSVTQSLDVVEPMESSQAENPSKSESDSGKLEVEASETIESPTDHENIVEDAKIPDVETSSSISVVENTMEVETNEKNVKKDDEIPAKVVTSMEFVAEAVPSMSMKTEVVPSMSINTDVLPSMSINAAVIPSTSINAEVISSMEINAKSVPTSVGINVEVVPSMEITETEESESNNRCSESNDHIPETSYEEAASSAMLVTPDDSSQTIETNDDEKHYENKELELSSDLDDKTKQSMESEDDSMANSVEKISEDKNTNNELCNEDAQDGFSKSSEIIDETKNEIVESRSDIIEARRSEHINEERSEMSIELPEDSSGDSVAPSSSSLAANPSGEDSTISEICETSSIVENSEISSLSPEDKVAPAPIVDANISKSPERITIESQKPSGSARLLDSMDVYTDEFSENPSSADQDSNEAMVIDDGASDSNDSTRANSGINETTSDLKTFNFKDKVSEIKPIIDEPEEKSKAACSGETSEIVFRETTSVVPSEKVDETKEEKNQSCNNDQDTLVDSKKDETSNLKDDEKISLVIVPEIGKETENFPETSKVEDTKSAVTDTDEKSTPVPQSSLVPNYDCSDDDDVSDDVFEMGAAEIENLMDQIDTEDMPTPTDDEITRLPEGPEAKSSEVSDVKINEKTHLIESEDKTSEKETREICKNDEEFSDNEGVVEKSQVDLVALTKTIETEKNLVIDEKLKICNERIESEEEEIEMEEKEVESKEKEIETTEKEVESKEKEIESEEKEIETERREIQTEEKDIELTESKRLKVIDVLVDDSNEIAEKSQDLSATPQIKSTSTARDLSDVSEKTRQIGMDEVLTKDSAISSKISSTISGNPKDVERANECQEITKIKFSTEESLKLSEVPVDSTKPEEKGEKSSISQSIIENYDNEGKIQKTRDSNKNIEQDRPFASQGTKPETSLVDSMKEEIHGRLETSDKTENLEESKSLIVLETKDESEVPEELEIPMLSVEQNVPVLPVENKVPVLLVEQKIPVLSVEPTLPEKIATKNALEDHDNSPRNDEKITILKSSSNVQSNLPNDDAITTIEKTNETITLSNAPVLIREEISDVLSLKNESKKEASKRLHGITDTDYFPPTKSRPPNVDFTKDQTENLVNDEKTPIGDKKIIESVSASSQVVTAFSSIVSPSEKIPSPILQPEIDLTEKLKNHEIPEIRENYAKPGIQVEAPIEQRSSEIQSVDIKCIDLESDDSMGIDNESMFDTPAHDVDPLACTEADLTKPTGLEGSSVPKIGIRVKPVADLVYEGWKLDSPEPPPAPSNISRKRRNSAHESNSEDPAIKIDDDAGETGGKRMKLRGKRSPDMKLRKTVEASRPESLSSEDEASKAQAPIETIEIKDNEDEEIIDIAKVRNERKPRGRPKGRRRRGNRSFPRAATRAKVTENKTDEPTVEASAVVPVTTPTDVAQPESKKKRKKRKMVLGLEIGIDIAVPDSQGGTGTDEIPVRQSRRIAQLKIKEEADKRRIEEETMSDPKENKKDRDGTEKKKRRKQKADSEDEPVVVVKEVEREVKSRKQRKKKKMSSTFNEAKPWQSSSGSSSDDEGPEEEEDEEIESEGSLLFKSDHEFSPESDLEKEDESEPLRRARTAKKSQSDVEDAEDEYACQKCGKVDHPEWILLCDTCDKGWHCSCLRPALMLIPEGDWFCPPCQHTVLVNKLRDSLKTFDQNSKKHENEVLRKKRLAFVGISLDNVLHKSEQADNSSRGSSRGSDNDSSSSSSESSSSSSSSEESEPVYQLRERRCANTYKFNEYDDMINAAIQDEVDAVRGAGNQGRGKDIATIVNAEKEEAQAEALKSRQLNQDDDDDDYDVKKSEKESDEDYKVDKDDADEDEEDQRQKPSGKKMLSRKKHRKLNSLDISSEDDPDSDEDFKGSSSDEEDDFDEQLDSSDDSFAKSKRRGRKGEARPVRRSTRAARTRYDADFIDDDSDDSDRPKRKKSRSVWEGSESEESDNSWRQRKKKSKTVPTPRLRATSKTKSRKKKKRKRIIVDSDNASDDNEETAEVKNEDEPEDAEVQQKAEVNREDTENTENAEFVKTTDENNDEEPQDKETNCETPLVEVENQKKKKKESTPKQKKAPGIRRKIIYGGLDDDGPRQEEETLARRTRGRKINYQDIMGSDSEEELKKVLRKTEESEEEFVVNEGEEFNEDAEKDSDSGDIYSPKKELPKGKAKSPKKMKKSPGGRKSLTDNGTPKQRKKPGPKPGSKNKPKDQPALSISPIIKPNDTDSISRGMDMEGSTMSATGSVIGEVPEGSLTGLTPDDINALDDEQLEQMMMEDEEYGRRQLELAAIEIARNKKQEEREAKKLEKARLKALEILAAEQQRDPNAPEGTDGELPKKKKRGRRSKAEILAEQMRRDGVPSLIAGNLLPTAAVAVAAVATSVVTDVTTPMVSPNIVVTTPTLPTVVAAPTVIPAAVAAAAVAAVAVETERSPDVGQLPMMMTGPDGQLFSPDGSPMKPKRRGRGKGKKTLALEAARAAEAAAKAAAGADIGQLGITGTDSNPDVKHDDIPNVLPTPGSSTSGSAPPTPPATSLVISQGLQPGQSPNQQQQQQQQQQQSVYPSLPPSQQSSVITRMLQSQPVSSTPQSFTAAAAAMGHKYFGGPNAAGQMMPGPRPSNYDMPTRGRIPSPYRQPGPSPMPPHFAAVRSGTPPMRMRVPSAQLYHTPHHPMDPSPSGGGPISINSRDRSSPLGPGPAMIPPAAGSPLAKGGPTPPPPPPPPYVRGGPAAHSRFSDNPQIPPRHQIPQFPTSSPANHAMQQPSPPPNRPSGNFSPYHPPPPPNYHYGAYPPPPPMTTADDAAAYQGSPYSAEHFSTPAESQPQIQPPPPPPPPQPQPQSQSVPTSQQQQHPSEPGQTNKQYDEEGTGEFGGLVSYFSSQREDDLDS